MQDTHPRAPVVLKRVYVPVAGRIHVQYGIYSFCRNGNGPELEPLIDPQSSPEDLGRLISSHIANDPRCDLRAVRFRIPSSFPTTEFYTQGAHANYQELERSDQQKMLLAYDHSLEDKTL